MIFRRVDKRKPNIMYALRVDGVSLFLVAQTKLFEEEYIVIENVHAIV